MEKTAKETYEVIRSGAEKAKGSMISMSSDDLLAAFEYLEGERKKPAQPKKIES